MLMRYHFGLGVGHVYAHGQATNGVGHSTPEEQAGEQIDAQIEDHFVELGEADASDVDEISDCGQDKDSEPSDDEEFMAMEEMYGII
jgi:hypothetical protein